MSAWATWIVATGVEAGLAALVLLGLVAVLRVEAKWASLVLLLALLGFLLPPGWGLRLPTPGVAGETGAGLATGRGWVGALVVGQAVGLVAWLVLVARSTVTVWRRRTRSRPMDEGRAADAIRAVARDLGVRTPTLYLTDDGFGPAATGVFRPVVFLPRTLADSLPADRLRMVLAHEVTHLGRLDPATGIVRSAVLALWWFHPVVWLLTARHRAKAEEACDDTVLHHGFGSADDYGLALLMCARDARPTPGFAHLGTHPLEHRIRRLMRPRSASARPLTTVGVVALAAALLPLGGDWTGGRAGGGAGTGRAAVDGEAAGGQAVGGTELGPGLGPVPGGRVTRDAAVRLDVAVDRRVRVERHVK